MRHGQEVKFEGDLRRCVTPTVELLGSPSRTASVCVGEVLVVFSLEPMELSESKRLMWCGEFPNAVVKLCSCWG
jgi:hypothetical protein